MEQRNPKSAKTSLVIAVVVYGVTLGLYVLYGLLPETRDPIAIGATQGEIAVLHPWVLAGIGWSTAFAALASLLLSILLLRRSMPLLAACGIVVAVGGYPASLVLHVIANLGGWTRHGVVTSASGDRYVFWDSSFLQGQRMAIGRRRGSDSWWTFYQVLVTTNGDSPRSCASLVRPAGSTDEYGQLYLTPDNLVVGVRYDNHCFLAYGIDDGKAYDRESIETLSPFVCLAADSEILTSDVDLTIGCIDEWQKQCADDKDIDPLSAS
jgi:hypothetical protein